MMYLLFLFSASAGFILSGYFLVITLRGKIYKHLFFLTLLYSLSSLISYGLLTDFFTEHPDLIGTPGSVVFLFTPVLYFFFLIQSGYVQKLKWTSVLHFLPFIQDIIFFLPFYMMPGTEKLQMLNRPLSGFSIMIISFGILYRWVYIGLIFRILRNSSLSDKTNRSFLFLIFFTHIFFVITGTASKISHFITTEDSFLSYILSFSGVTGIFIIAYFFIRHRKIFETDFFILNKEQKKYSTSSLSKDEITRIDKQLQTILENEKLYLDPDLTLRSLAEKLNVLPNNLSQAINIIYKENFNKFINRHRISEVKKLLKDPEKTVLEAAFSCGFNSKSSFNQAFKEICNQTPTQFRKNQTN